jgi:hypothetical protein
VILTWIDRSHVSQSKCRAGGRKLAINSQSNQVILEVLPRLRVSFAFLVIIFIVSQGLGNLLQAEPNEAVRNLIPRSSTQVFLFLTLTFTAGFCEEVIYRGYLLRQFAAQAIQPVRVEKDGQSWILFSFESKRGA